MEDTRVDPRITRTRKHVLGTAQVMLRERTSVLTFHALAARALVSTRTLQTHWDDVETVVIESFSLAVPDGASYLGLDAKARLDRFMSDISRQLCGDSATTFATIVSNGIHHEGSRRALEELRADLYRSLTAHVGNFSLNEFSQLLSPLFFSTITDLAPDDGLIGDLVGAGTSMLAAKER